MEVEFAGIASEMHVTEWNRCHALSTLNIGEIAAFAEIVSFVNFSINVFFVGGITFFDWFGHIPKQRE